MAGITVFLVTEDMMVMSVSGNIQIVAVIVSRDRQSVPLPPFAFDFKPKASPFIIAHRSQTTHRSMYAAYDISTLPRNNGHIKTATVGKIANV